MHFTPAVLNLNFNPLQWTHLVVYWSFGLLRFQKSNSTPPNRSKSAKSKID